MGLPACEVVVALRRAGLLGPFPRVEASPVNGGPPPPEQAAPPVAPCRSGAGWVLGLALLVRMAVVVWAGPRIPPAADGVFYHTIGARIAKGLGYTWLAGRTGSSRTRVTTRSVTPRSSASRTPSAEHIRPRRWC
ncbi:MAG: hypothetical protein R3B70_16530 [Polyangiaceae bacterium]